MRALLALLALAALLAGCSSRERANPLDPSNPVTGGRPAGFTATAGYTLVSLAWTPQPGLAIDGFELQRLAPGDSLYRSVAGLFPATASRYIDLDVTNDQLVRYRLYYVIRGSLAHLPAEDHATPGAARPWVSDRGARLLVRLSPDGRRVVATANDAGDVLGLAVDVANGRIWTAAPNLGLVTARFPDLQGQLGISGLGQPYQIAVSPLDHGVWICDLGGTVRHRASDGSGLAPNSIAGLSQPEGLAISTRDFSVWFGENGGNRVQHVNAIGTLIATAFVLSPSRIAVDSLSGQAWVTSFATGRIWRVSALGARLDSTSVAAGPIGIAIDHRRGHVWVADASGDRVLMLDLATMAALASVTGVPGAREVSVDLYTGDAWVVARASGEVVHLSPTGAVLERIGGFVDPMDVRVDPGR